MSSAWLNSLIGKGRTDSKMPEKWVDPKYRVMLEELTKLSPTASIVSKEIGVEESPLLTGLQGSLGRHIFKDWDKPSGRSFYFPATKTAHMAPNSSDWTLAHELGHAAQDMNGLKMDHEPSVEVVQREASQTNENRAKLFPEPLQIPKVVDSWNGSDYQLEPVGLYKPYLSKKSLGQSEAIKGLKKVEDQR